MMIKELSVRGKEVFGQHPACPLCCHDTWVGFFLKRRPLSGVSLLTTMKELSVTGKQVIGFDHPNGASKIFKSKSNSSRRLKAAHIVGRTLDKLASYAQNLQYTLYEKGQCYGGFLKQQDKVIRRAVTLRCVTVISGGVKIVSSKDSAYQ